MSTPIRLKAIEDAVKTLRIAADEFSGSNDVREIGLACQHTASRGEDAVRIWKERKFPSVMTRLGKGDVEERVRSGK